MFVEITIELLTFSQLFRAFSNFLSLACSSFLAFSRRFACSLIDVDFIDRFLENGLLTESELFVENGLLINENGEDRPEVLTENGVDLGFTDP